MKLSISSALAFALLAVAPFPSLTEDELAPGPCLEKRQQVLDYLKKARTAGIGVGPYEDAMQRLETNVKEGKPEEEIKRQVDSLVSSLAQQVNNMKALKAAGAGSGASAADYAKYKMSALKMPESMMENMLFDLTNKHRKEAGLSTLRRSSQLSGMARSHCQDMVTRSFFGHKNPDGEDYMVRAQKVGLKCSIMENVASVGAGRGNSYHMILQADQGLMSSAGHYRNIMNKDGKSAGYAVCYDIKKGGIKVCQVFSMDDI